MEVGIFSLFIQIVFMGGVDGDIGGDGDVIGNVDGVTGNVNML